MTVKRNKKIFWYLAVSFVCLATVSLCLTSCRLQSLGSASSGDTSTDAPSTQQDAYEGKILYYETKLQSLTTRLSDMEQQMYLMHEDYMKGLQTLEQKINQSNASSERGYTDNEQKPPQDAATDVGVKPEVPGEQMPADDGKEEVALCEYTYQLKKNFAVLTAYLGKDEHVVVPAAVDGYLVIALADRTFADCNVQSVTLPETIESIGWFTFYGCDNLEKVTLPAKLSSIGYASFDGCAPTLCLHVQEGSYAERFANSFGLRYEVSISS